mmetsp:Transcript_12809/g.20138  ORF Transcript_12809/g.20138 Transcript_12809/m.20138 type:complete len:289 (+) Transcript_12809:716-1582(+)
MGKNFSCKKNSLFIIVVDKIMYNNNFFEREKFIENKSRGVRFKSQLLKLIQQIFVFFSLISNLGLEKDFIFVFEEFSKCVIFSNSFTKKKEWEKKIDFNFNLLMSIFQESFLFKSKTWFSALNKKEMLKPQNLNQSPRFLDFFLKKLNPLLKNSKIKFIIIGNYSRTQENPKNRKEIFFILASRLITVSVINFGSRENFCESLAFFSKGVYINPIWDLFSYINSSSFIPLLLNLTKDEKSSYEVFKTPCKTKSANSILSGKTSSENFLCLRCQISFSIPFSSCLVCGF